MTKKAVVLLSGGLDSATVAYIAKSDVGKTGQVFPISFLYGQRHLYELVCADKIAKSLGTELKTVTIGLKSLIQSSLTGSSDIPTEGVQEGKIPSTWVPQRNSIFLSLAFAYAENLDADLIYAGMNVLDYSGYPDCRQVFLQAMEKSLNLASKRFVESGKGFGLSTPLIKMSKAEIINRGLTLNVPYQDTWSCYQGPDELKRACGVCDSCRLRLKGFSEVGVPDPIKYAKETE